VATQGQDNSAVNADDGKPGKVVGDAQLVFNTGDYVLDTEEDDLI
jgi:hypothetical protein